MTRKDFYYVKFLWLSLLLSLSFSVNSSTGEESIGWKSEITTLTKKMKCIAGTTRDKPAVHMFRNKTNIYLVCESMMSTLFYPFDDPTIHTLMGGFVRDPIEEFSSQIAKDKRAITRDLQNKLERFELVKLSKYENSISPSLSPHERKALLQDLWEEAIQTHELVQVWLAEGENERQGFYSLFIQQGANFNFALNKQLDVTFIDSHSKSEEEFRYLDDPTYSSMDYLPGMSVATVIDAPDWRYVPQLELNMVVAQGGEIYRLNIDDLWMVKSDYRAGTIAQTVLRNARFMKSDLRHADLVALDIYQSDFTKANLAGASLNTVEFSCSNEVYLDNAGPGCHNFSEATFIGAAYEVFESNSIKAELQIAGVKGIEHWYVEDIKATPTIYPFRASLIAKGMTSEAKAITYVINKSIDDFIFRESDDSVELLLAYLRNTLFDKTVKYGADPSHALLVLMYVFIYFTIFYVAYAIVCKVALSPSRFSLVIKVNDTSFPLNRYFEDAPQTNWHIGPRTTPNLIRAIRFAGHIFWFSLLSSFHIGWRDLNLGTWLSRLQPRHFVYEPSGVLRVVSGIQSLVSVFLVALCVVSSFGHPFLNMG